MKHMRLLQQSIFGASYAGGRGSSIVMPLHRLVVVAFVDFRDPLLVMQVP